MTKFLILLLLLSSGLQFGESNYVGLIKAVIKLVGYFNSASSTKDNMHNAYTAIVSKSSEDSKKIEQSVDGINDRLDYMNYFLTNKVQEIDNVIHNLEAKGKIEELESKLSIHMQKVNFAIREINDTVKNRENVPTSRLQDLIDDHDDELLRSVEAMQMELAPDDDRNRAKGLAEWYQILTTGNALYRCGTGNSAQQLLLGLYVDILETEVKAMEALSFFASLKRANDAVWEILMQRFVHRYNAYVKSFKKVFHQTLRDYRFCDPQNGWERNVSFYELERYNQATTFHTSLNMESLIRRPRCEDWSDKVLAKQDWPQAGCENERSEACWFSKKEMCKGTLHNCLGPASITTCSNHIPSSSRRYEWMKNLSRKENYGNIHIPCYTNAIRPTYGYGATCVCHCLQRHNRIYLVLSKSNIEKNKVITAMRFQRKNNIVFIQIKHGVLMPNGKIDDEADKWFPSIPDPSWDKVYAYTSPGQGIDLDDLQGDDDEVLTGIGFERDHVDQRVKLQIRVTKFNYVTGKLGDESRMISGSDDNRPRESLGINNPLTNNGKNVPTTAPMQNSRKYITFERSSLTSDAGQTTLPLFDGVAIEGKPPSPMSGVGLFHKAVDGYGGFVSLRAFSINIAKYFDENVELISTDVFNEEGKSFIDIINELLKKLAE